ncbi:MAG TPA: hypothetical protein PK358_12915 [Spirochaetota bacterium]|nr:hypothetical protein [Spirochaetota bacterium]HPJ35731.1 hypothetical protein [Spirochaetota bacterium]
MKPGCFYNIILSFFIIFMFLIYGGCIRPVGKCTYGEKPAETGVVKIKSIEKIMMNNRPHFRVKVEGMFSRYFVYDEAEFNRCFKSAGYTTGSEIQGSVFSGGPCPPLYRLNVCGGK